MSDGVTATPAAEDISRELIARVDASGQLADVLALPEHLRDAVWRVESAIMQDWDTSAGLVVAGMGGSAIGGALARAALGDHASRPIFVTRAYGLPTWTTPDTMVLCASYSGDTEETLACYESAGALGAKRTVVTTGGRLAEMARADGVPRDPAPRRLSAASGGRLHDRRRARGRRPVRRRAAADLGDRRRRLPHRAARRRVGPRRARGLAGQGGRPRSVRHDPRDRRRRPHDADRLPLEDADQRERQAALLLATSCPSSTTTRSPAGRARATSVASRRSSSTTPTPTRG